MRIVVKPEPELTPALEEAIRNHMAFNTVGHNGSGFWSVHKPHKFCCQVDGSLIAIYDTEAEHWFIIETTIASAGWFLSMLEAALKGVEITRLPRKQLRNIYRFGYVEVVRNRLNIEKEK